MRTMQSRVRRGWLGVTLAGAAAGAATLAVVLGATPASAEATSTTATLTVTGVLDSNCTVSTGGTTVYVAPGGTIDFRAALAGISVDVAPVGVIPLTTSSVASFVDTLIINGDTAHPHSVTGTQDYVLSGVSGNLSFSWSATSVQLLPIPLLLPQGLTVPLNADTVVPSSLPVGAKLAWNGAISTSKTATCGISAQLPGVSATVGPVKVSVPPVALPSVTLPALPALPGGSSAPAAGSGSSAGSGSGSGIGYTDPGQQVPAGVVPKGDGGLNAQGGGGTGGGGADGKHAARPGTGVLSPGASATTAAKTVDLSSAKTPSAAQIPVVLAILAILALALVTAMYARMYLLRRSS